MAREAMRSIGTINASVYGREYAQTGAELIGMTKHPHRDIDLAAICLLMT